MSHGIKNCHRNLQTNGLKTSLSCNDTVELAYYSSETQTARKDICCFCAALHAEINANLKQQYKTVLPICHDCVAAGKTAVYQRPIKKYKY